MKKNANKNFRFNADTIHVTEEKGVLMVSFADSDSKTPKYLILERALHPKQQDIDLGHNEVYLELNTQGLCGYGMLKSIHIDKDKILFTLNDKGFKSIFLNEIIVEAGFSLFPKLNDSLTRLVEGTIATIDA